MNRKTKASAIGATLLALLLTAALAPAAQKGDPKEELVNSVRAWLDAEANHKTADLDRMIDENFMGTGFGGNILDKSDIVPSEGSDEARMPKSVLQDATARIFENTGVVMGTLGMQTAGHSAAIRFTLVFVKKAQGWQMVAAHMARAPQE